MKHRTLKTSAVMGMLLSMVLGTSVYAAPIGGQVVSGNSTINQGGNTTTINQKSQNTQINWQKFNIAKNETVNFVQPNKSAVALNKVVGNDASVNVGGLVASTLDIKANENGKYTIGIKSGTASTAAISFGGKDAASAFAQASYKISDTEQFDFANTWYMIEGQTRPMLRAFKATKGTDNIYHITNLQQLQDMTYDLSGNYVLDNNIDASATAGTDISSVWGSS